MTIFFIICIFTMVAASVLLPCCLWIAKVAIIIDIYKCYCPSAMKSCFFLVMKRKCSTFAMKEKPSLFQFDSFFFAALFLKKPPAKQTAAAAIATIAEPTIPDTLVPAGFSLSEEKA